MISQILDKVPVQNKSTWKPWISEEWWECSTTTLLNFLNIESDILCTWSWLTWRNQESIPAPCCRMLTCWWPALVVYGMISITVNSILKNILLILCHVDFSRGSTPPVSSKNLCYVGMNLLDWFRSFPCCLRFAMCVQCNSCSIVNSCLPAIHNREINLPLYYFFQSISLDLIAYLEFMLACPSVQFNFATQPILLVDSFPLLWRQNAIILARSPHDKI
jgi:hypothetical protein